VFAIFAGGFLYAMCSAFPSKILEFAGSGMFLTYFSHGFSAHISEFFGRIGRGDRLPDGVRQVWMMSFPFLYMLLASVATKQITNVYGFVRLNVEVRCSKPLRDLQDRVRSRLLDVRKSANEADWTRLIRRRI
jgi:hypothetical protein